MEVIGNIKRINLPDMTSWVDIREQNGQDDDILSNPVKSQTLHNFSEFISQIVVKTNITANGRLTEAQAHELPCNLRYAILIASRIFSLGNTMEFSYNWGDEVVAYEQDLNEVMFNDYHQSPTEEELLAKPFAVPYYPNGAQKEFVLVLSSGKEVKYNLMNALGEVMMMNTPLKTKNLEIKARGLKLKVNGNWESVENFSLFSVKDMVEIRKSMAENDPIYLGIIELEHPTTKQRGSFSLMGTSDFFYMGGF